MKKQIISFLLVLVLLATLLPMFASCTKRTVALSDYHVVCGNDLAAYTKRCVSGLVDLLKEKTGEKIGLTTVNLAKEDTVKSPGYEILIGNTNREESQKALSRIKGYGYSITLSGDCIVIVGSTNLLTSMAIDYFTDHFLSGEIDANACVIEEVVVEEQPMLEITTETAFIHSAILTESDYPVSKIVDIKTAISEASDVRAMSMSIKPDSDSSPIEILLGSVERTEFVELVGGMKGNDYGVAVRYGKLLITALHNKAMKEAIELASSILRDSVTVVGQGDAAEKKLLLPVGFTRIETLQGNSFAVDFPQPDGLHASSALDVSDSSLEYIYKGEGLSVSHYEAYCKKLEAAGYTRYMSHSAEGSYFSTYNNVSAGVTLQVSYAAFAHAAEQEVTHFSPVLRVISAPLSAVNLINEAYLAPDYSYQKRQNSSITALRVSYNDKTSTYWGNIYVVTLEDGSFIVLDGGTGTTADVKRIYECLLDLYRRGHGGADPTAENPITIAAWYLSHEHSDHFVNMQNFIYTYCAHYDTTPIVIKSLIANFTSNQETDWHYVRNRVAEYASHVKGGMKYIKVHTGQKFYIANAAFEVMYTHEDLFPRRIKVYNDSSTVIRMTLQHTENGVVTEGSAESVLWLGDAQSLASKCMRAMWGEYLASDMVQVAHHGYSGCEIKLYQLVSPTCVWWPTGRREWSSAYHNEATTGYKKVSYQINYELPTVKYVILSDDCNYTVSITAAGADYRLEGDSPTGVFSAGEVQAVVASPMSKDAYSSFIVK